MPTDEPPKPVETPEEPEVPEEEKLSHRMLDLASPLLRMLPEPASLEAFRQVMQLVEIVWNLDSIEARDPVMGKSARALFEKELTQAPPQARALMEALLETRRVRYADDLRVAHIVEITTEGDDFIVHAAEANYRSASDS